MQFINYGDGRSGSAAGVSGTVNTYATCTATAGTRTVTTALSVSIGDQVVLIQSRGTGVGGWEIVQAETASVAGAFTTTTALDNSYVSGAQAILIPLYTTGALGAVTAQSWNGSTGGIGFIIGNGVISGAVSLVGSVNDSNTGVFAWVGTGGFAGGPRDTAGQNAFQGEGTIGIGATGNTAANGSGGGTGSTGNTVGGGGGHATAGNNGNGTGGVSAGSANLTTMVFGGGAGGSGDSGPRFAGIAGNGGGIWVIIAPTINITGASSVNGGDGATQNGTGGSGGAGGSFLLKGVNISLGSALITAAAGVGSGGLGGDASGVNGSVGRIAIYSPNQSNVTGTTSPTYTFVADNNLSQGTQGFII